MKANRVAGGLNPPAPTPLRLKRDLRPACVSPPEAGKRTGRVTEIIPSLLAGVMNPPKADKFLSQLNRFLREIQRDKPSAL